MPHPSTGSDLAVPSSSHRAKRWLLPAVLVGGVLLTLAHRLSADEGQILTGAWNLYSGHRLYTDFFEFIGPASFAWVDLFFELLGPGYWTALVASQVLLLVSLWAFVRLAVRVVGNGPPLVAVCLLWLVMATAAPFINHNSYGTYLAVLFALSMVELLDSGSLRAAVAGGIVAGVTFFFLQPKGGALIVAGLLVLAWWGLSSGAAHARSTHRNAIAAWVVACGLSLLGGFAVWGLWPVRALLTVAEDNLAMNHLAISYGPPLVATGLWMVAAWAVWREGLMDRSMGFLLLLQGALWMSTIHLPDHGHLAINAFPILLVLARLAHHSLSRQPTGADAGLRRARALMAGLFVLVLGLWLGRNVLRNVEDTRATHQWLGILEEILGGESFFAHTFLPSFYLELETENPYFNSVLYTSSHPRAHFERNVRLMSEHRPRFVLADYGSVARYAHDLDNPVDDYVRAHYQLAWQLPHATGVLEVWERR